MFRWNVGWVMFWRAGGVLTGVCIDVGMASAVRQLGRYDDSVLIRIYWSEWSL